MIKPKPLEMTNEQVVVRAAFTLRGHLSKVDTEDVAIEADHIAPSRFRWVKHKRHINIELVHAALRDAKRHGLLEGAGSVGWRLTDRGLGVAKSFDGARSNVESRPFLSAQERKWRSKERTRLLTEDAFLKFQREGVDAPSSRELDRFFRVDEYVTGPSRSARIDRIVRAFERDDNLGDAVKQLATRMLQP
jgi:hypothetical protein